MNAIDDLVDLTKTRSGGSPMAGAFVGGAMEYPDQDDITEWILDFDYAKNPLPMNGSHGHHHGHAKKVRTARTLARREANLAGIPPLGRARVQLTWYVLARGRRDPINLSLLVKAMCDGLVDHGATTDDTPDLMDTPTSRIIRVDPALNPSAWMELSVTRWDGTR